MTGASTTGTGVKRSWDISYQDTTPVESLRPQNRMRPAGTGFFRATGARGRDRARGDQNLRTHRRLQKNIDEYLTVPARKELPYPVLYGSAGKKVDRTLHFCPFFAKSPPLQPAAPQQRALAASSG